MSEQQVFQNRILAANEPDSFHYSGEIGTRLRQTIVWLSPEPFLKKLMINSESLKSIGQSTVIWAVLKIIDFWGINSASGKEVALIPRRERLKQNRWKIFRGAGLTVVIILGCIILRQQRIHDGIHSTVGHTLSGNEIMAMKFIPVGRKDPSSRNIRFDGPAFVFIFESPCVPCNDNIPYWNNICRMVDGRARCLAVLTGASGEGSKILDNRLDFPLYRPEDWEAFSRALGLGEDGAALTLFICDGKILEIYRGRFAGDAFAHFVNACKFNL